MIHGPGKDGNWNVAALEDLRLWLLSERLPPEVDFDDLVLVVDMALSAADYQEMKDRCEDAEKERDMAVEDNVSHEKLEDELREEISELKGVVARLTETK